MTAIRVLRVDDDRALLDVAAAFLGQHDLSVTSVTSPKEGLERLEAAPFDCVVSDYRMPGHDGLWFLEAARARYPNVPFVPFTGQGSEEVASDGIAAGVTDYLGKETTPATTSCSRTCSRTPSSTVGGRAGR